MCRKTNKEDTEGRFVQALGSLWKDSHKETVTVSGQESWGLRGSWDRRTCYALMSYPWTLLQCEHTACPPR